MKNKTISKSRFTLIELLVVIAIIGILTGILLPAIAGSMKEGKKTKAKAQVSQIAFAIESYKSEYGSLPTAPNGTYSDSGVLTALSSSGNARSKSFYDGTLTDVFGGTVKLKLDIDYDGQVTSTDTGGTTPPEDPISGSCAVWTTYEGDNIVSWQK